MGASLDQRKNNAVQTQQLTGSILQAVRRKYRSFSNPHLGFVQKALERRPYRKLIDFLMWPGFAVRELTDFDYDVSFSYVLTSDRGMWALDLSMVGPYAIFARIEDGKVTLLDCPVRSKKSRSRYARGRDTPGDDEQFIRDVAAHHGLLFLPRGVLLQKVNVRIPRLDPDEVRIYHVLFTHVSEPPAYLQW
jgi:hypothetical protein